ncbi:recombination protein F [Gloeomargarita lithophora Alchichica-D10]|uniref:DNA replication and repair protein RecF n=1 Tax=Gloeomargarita lithophora Alchichica-D10 TaxID=1188229 RepID=A0A1J0ABE8_9CYAN|nr:DNA replication/repair protein RecF [Gloeomargarita lithophora]APB33260.1 recombination protein F [Gloeomargarita lithophora Alchichica-D10]
MYLHQLNLWHFRNYTEQAITFNGNQTILLGDNAQGKSNLLEAILLLATLHSPRSQRDGDLIQFQQETARIQAQVIRQPDPAELSLILRASGRRTPAVNQQTQRRQMDFLGYLRTVFFSCLDLELVRGGPGQRRDWLDQTLVQLEPLYSQLLQDYQRVIRQRNALLRQETVTPAHLTPWNDLLIQTGTRLIRRRFRLLERLVPLAQTWHQRISQALEVLAISYAPCVPVLANENEAIREQFQHQLTAKLPAELAQKTTLVGPHRDEVHFGLNGHPARTYASQGQQRTLVLALKLAELELLETVLGETPVLLLDDVLAELDLKRQQQLLTVISERVQTIITTTDLERFYPPWLQAAQQFQVVQGQLFPR